MSPIKNKTLMLLIGLAVFAIAIMSFMSEEVPAPQKFTAFNNEPEPAAELQQAEIVVKNTTNNLHSSQKNIKNTGMEDDDFESGQY